MPKPRKPGYCKRKGNAFEREVVNKLKEIGYDVGTARAESKAEDDMKIDIHDRRGDLPTNIQTKYMQVTPNYFDIAEACPIKSKPFTVI